MASPSSALSSPTGSAAAPKVSWETFRKKYLSKEDKFKYEWVDGKVEKTPRTKDKTQFFLQNNLVNFLNDLKTKYDFRGQLIAEGDIFFNGNHRRPDLAYYSDAQIQAARINENVVPEFVIEVISSKDQMNLVYKKMKDYRAAKVKVIWLIFPELKEVHVFQGKQMKIRVGEDLCSAEVVVEGFSLSVDELFR